MLVRTREGPIEKEKSKKCQECGEWNKKEKDACWNCGSDIR